MAMNRIQFQKGLSWTEFYEIYGTEEKCEQVLESVRWPNGFVCPKCQHPKANIVRHGRVKTFQCKSCRQQTTLTSDTVMHGSRLPLTIWFQAIQIVTLSKNNTSALQLMRELGICYRSAWRLKHKLLQLMLEREEPRKLSGTVVVDDSYLGGERRGGKTGRGSENKVPFVAAVETTGDGLPTQIILSVVKGFSRLDIKDWAIGKISEGSQVMTDGLNCFRGIWFAGSEHLPVVVGPGRKSTELPCFEWINTILGNLKTAISGTYHSFKFRKYASRYLAEFQYRFNRRYDMAAVFIRLLTAVAVTGGHSEAWLRAAEG